jgi:hypothetical protein
MAIERDHSRQSVSDAIETSHYARGSFIIPAAFTGTVITFSVSRDDSTYFNQYDEGNNQISYTVATSRAYPLPPEVFDWPFVKLTSGSAEGAARTIHVALSS